MAILQASEIKKGKGKAVLATIITILVIGIPFQLLPYMWMVFNCFKKNTEIIRVPPTILPEVWRLDGFVETFAKYHLWQNIYNTFVLCAGIILIQVSISALAAFSLSKLKPVWGKGILLFFVGTMMISSQALMFPLFIMMSDFPLLHVSLINSHWSYILASSAWGYSVFLFKGFFDGLPNELLESAKIDGASSMKIFFNIILPLSKPVIAVNVLNTFVAVYNDFLLPSLLLPNEKKWPLIVRIFSAQEGASASPVNVFTMLTVATIPVIVLYLFAQKKIVQGISMSGLKG